MTDDLLSMPRHPDYDAWQPSWRLMRDAYDGEEAIKGQALVRREAGEKASRSSGEEYLPRPSGMQFAPDPKAAYLAYKMRAVYPELVSPTVRGMAGVIHGKPTKFDLPSSLEAMRERATLDGMALDSLHRRTTREVLTVGRYGLLTDLPSSGGEPYLAGYTAESIVNWDLDDDLNLAFLVLDESAYERSPGNGEWVWRRRWRTLEMVEGAYTVRVDRQTESGVERGKPMVPTMRGGGRLNFIPFTFVDTNDLTPEPDEIPLLPLARLAAAIYRGDADYRHALLLTSQPTPWVSGADPDNPPQTIGSNAVWMLPQGAQAGYLEFTGAALSAQRSAINDDLERAVQLGARLLADMTGQQESGEARRLRYANETATLTSIAQNVGAGLERALRYAARWIGAAEDQVVVTPDTDFMDQVLSPQDIDALVRSWQSGSLSRQTLFDNLQRGGIIAEDRTYEEEVAAIDSEGAGLGMIGRENVDKTSL